MSDMKKVNDMDLNKVAGGFGGDEYMSLATPCVDQGYLALRSQPCWDDSNEICQIYPGETFYVDTSNVAYGSGYAYYYANYDGIRGWVNVTFLSLLD